eukprot:12906396-Prorocentrum_lima.AAC.1
MSRKSRVDISHNLHPGECKWFDSNVRHHGQERTGHYTRYPRAPGLAEPTQASAPGELSDLAAEAVDIFSDGDGEAQYRDGEHDVSEGELRGCPNQRNRRTRR